MSASAMSLKARIKNLAQKKNIKAQVLLQNYMFERFLERLSLSEYKDKLVWNMMVALCYLAEPLLRRQHISG